MRKSIKKSKKNTSKCTYTDEAKRIMNMIKEVIKKNKTKKNRSKK
jgi:hypothetical protein